METGSHRGFDLDLDDTRRTDNQIFIATSVEPITATVSNRTTRALPPSCIEEGGTGVIEKGRDKGHGCNSPYMSTFRVVPRLIRHVWRIISISIASDPGAARSPFWRYSTHSCGWRPGNQIKVGLTCGLPLECCHPARTLPINQHTLDLSAC